MLNNKWVRILEPSPQAQMRMFCFPYAGGSSAAYLDWSKQLLPEIEICAIRLPGRVDRLTEFPISQMQELVDGLYAGIESSLGPRFAFFGHSIGALIAFELARRLQAARAPLPEHLFVSARRAPQHSHLYPVLHDLPTTQLLGALREIFSVPPELMANEEMFEHARASIQPDLVLVETYQFQEKPPLPCPITAFAGKRDPSFTPREATAWGVHTTGDFRLHVLPGDHFLLRCSGERMLNVIRGQLLTEKRAAG